MVANEDEKNDDLLREFSLTMLMGIVMAIFLFLNTLCWGSLILLLALIRCAVPIISFKKRLGLWSDVCGNRWVQANRFMLRYMGHIDLEVNGCDQFDTWDPKQWYLLISNHQSYMDILILQSIFYKKMPFIKFFMKKELFWMPFIGIVWWAMGFPFIKRYSKEMLRKKPHLIGKDTETMQRICDEFKLNPVSVAIFLEGTRFTAEKKALQRSPYQYLLKPKSAGVAYVSTAMRDCIQYIVDVTIAYPHGKKGFLDFILGRIHKVKVEVRVIPVQDNCSNPELSVLQRQKNNIKWVNQLWADKDRAMKKMMGEEKSDESSDG